jgi:hypothetical protein
MKRVILESPFAGDVDANVRYARACMRDCLERGEAPIASHLLYTQPGILDDQAPAERQWGILAGLAWRPAAELSVFYTDRGWSDGMLSALKSATEGGWPFELRSLAGQPAAPPVLAGCAERQAQK